MGFYGSVSVAEIISLSVAAHVSLPDVLFLVFLGDQLILSVVFQLVSGNLPEDLHVLCKIQLYATLLQVVLSGHTHTNRNTS